jgi:NAD(P)-dependent dehydrogenase (short-subunit alcohol dehydrogenase family)
MMMVTACMTLTGMVALIIGSTSGLGRHFATVLAAAGATVILTARRGAMLEAVAAL